MQKIDFVNINADLSTSIYTHEELMTLRVRGKRLVEQNKKCGDDA